MFYSHILITYFSLVRLGFIYIHGHSPLITPSLNKIGHLFVGPPHLGQLEQCHLRIILLEFCPIDINTTIKIFYNSR